MTPRRAIVLVVAAWCAGLGCNDAPKPVIAVTHPVGEGGAPYSLDSALKVFRVGLEPVTELQAAESSIDRAVARLVEIVERSDTAGLRALVMSRREFAWLYYPTSPFTREPTKQEPGLVWFLHIQNSQKGATRLMNRYGSGRLRLLSNECRGPARVEGGNTIWDDCLQRILEGGDTVVTRLFGGVIARDGRVKIFSYSNDL